jgi:hypothetical protein
MALPFVTRETYDQAQAQILTLNAQLDACDAERKALLSKILTLSAEKQAPAEEVEEPQPSTTRRRTADDLIRQAQDSVNGGKANVRHHHA